MYTSSSKPRGLHQLLNAYWLNLINILNCIQMIIKISQIVKTIGPEHEFREWVSLMTTNWILHKGGDFQVGLIDIITHQGLYFLWIIRLIIPKGRNRSSLGLGYNGSFFDSLCFLPFKGPSLNTLHITFRSRLITTPCSGSSHKSLLFEKLEVDHVSRNKKTKAEKIKKYDCQ